MNWGRSAWLSVALVAVAGLACGAERETKVLTAAAPTRPGSVKVGDWPQFRGPNRDDISAETGILQDWPDGGPKLLWTCRDLGRGYSGPSIVGDKIYIMGTKDKEAELAMCVSRKDGKVLWATPVGEFYDNGWGGGPRASPTVDGTFVYVLTGKGILACLNAQTGKGMWSKDLVKDFGGKVQAWGYCESPLVDGDMVLATPGGSNFMVGFNKRTGAPMWKSSGLDDAAQYSSIMKMEVGKIPLYLTMTKAGLVGVNAKNGEFQWRFEKTGNGTAVIPTPIFYDDFVYSTSGYGTGCGLVKLAAADGKVTAEEIYFNKDMVNHHGGVILKDGHIYGYSDGKGWICQKVDTGETVWRERGALGKGSITYADNRFYCFSENEGKCVLIEASTEGWKEHGSFTIPEETKLERGSGKIWTHPVVSQGQLFLRDQDLLFCFEVKGK